MSDEPSTKKSRKDYQEDYYQTQGKSKKYNTRYRENWSETFSSFFRNDFHEEFKELESEYWLANENVYGRLMELFEALVNENPAIDDESELNIFHSSDDFAGRKQWCMFSLHGHYNAILIAQGEEIEKRYEITPQDTLQKYHPGLNFFAFLNQSDIQHLFNSFSWLRMCLKIVTGLENKCLIQVSMMCDQRDYLATKFEDKQERYFHYDLALSGSLGLTFIIFLDNDISGNDGVGIVTRRGKYVDSASKGDGDAIDKLSYVFRTVLLMTGKTLHYSEPRRIYGRHICRMGEHKTQRRFLLINCCPYSKLNLLDQVLNSDVYMLNNEYELRNAVHVCDFSKESPESIGGLLEDDISFVMDHFPKIDPEFHKVHASKIKSSYKK